MKSVAVLFVSLILGCISTVAQEPTLRDIHKVFIEKMPNDLDQYLTAEISTRLKGRLIVVLNRSEADASIKGTGTHNDGTGAAIASRYTGSDTATGAIALVADDVILWSAQEGDHNLWIGANKRGPRKVAERLVSDLKKALENAK